MKTVQEKNNYSLRLPFEFSDEIGQLTKGFNEMIAEIEKRDLALQQSEEKYRYFFDNSGKLISGTETRRAAPITRIERFGLGINRVDSFLIGLGVEGMFEKVRPFLEWNLGIPINRQGYTCDPAKSYSGDACLGNNASFSTIPSTLTLGVRGYPFVKGLEALAAIDVGTSGTSTFLEELAPTPKWDLWLGLGWAIDAQEPPPPEPKKAEAVAKAERKIRGFVHELAKFLKLDPTQVTRTYLRRVRTTDRG